MSDFTLNILGCGSATPTHRHLPSAHALDFRGQVMMVDCGEGAQVQYRHMKLKFSRLNHIFISHLHGDHFLGLPGLLSTLALHDTGGHITVHTFAEGAEVLKHIMDVFCNDTPFTIDYDIIEPERAVILDDKSLTVETIPLHHRVPTVGFVFREKLGLRHLRGEMVRFHEIPVAMLPRIKAGEDYVRPDGRVIANELLTTDPNPPASYAYLSDTAYFPGLARMVEGVETIYHESTYLADCAHLAAKRGHSTAAEAGMTARDAGAKRLILGHYSQRYDDDEAFVREAATTFDGEIIAAREGLKIDLK